MPAAGQKRRRYKTLEVDRVDLVDRGANFDRATGDGSHILLVKRDPKAGEQPSAKQAIECPSCGKALPVGYADRGMTLPNYCPECGAKLTLRAAAKSEEKPMPAATATETQDVNKIVADALAKQAAEFDAKLKAEREAIEKAAAEKAEAEKKALEDRLTKAETERAAEIEKRETADAVAVVKGWASLALDADKDGALLYRIGKALTAEDHARVREILAAANEQVRVGKLFAATGKQGEPPAPDAQGNPEQVLLAKAAELRAKDPKLSEADSIDEACRLFPAERAAYQAFKRQQIGVKGV